MKNGKDPVDFGWLLDWIDDIAIVEIVRQRKATDTGERWTIEELAEHLGIDLSELDLNEES
jgi:hypothetical protein